jgi:FAD/FMN-containing dehydrogenase
VHSARRDSAARPPEVERLAASIRGYVRGGAATYLTVPEWYVNQSADAAGTARMRRLTGELIDLAARHGGTFFLPYQLHYTPEQLARAYPRIGDFFAAKRRWDPDGRFTSTFYERYGLIRTKGRP